MAGLVDEIRLSNLGVQREEVRRNQGSPDLVEQCRPGYERYSSLGSGSAPLSPWSVRRGT